MLRTAISSINLENRFNFEQAPIEPQHSATLLFCMLWGIGQAALLMDSPHLIPAFEAESTTTRQQENVTSVEYEGHSGRLILRVRTSDREEFHRLAEAKHVVEQYYARVEDIWRKVGLIPVPLKFDLSFPLWRYRSVESHTLRVDPNPISKLLTKEKLGYWTLDNSVDLHRRCSSTRWLPECRSSSLFSH